MTEKKVVIFCSSSYEIDRKYNLAAREAVRAVCSLGYTVVSGGAIKGTMGVVADEVVRCGGRHVGVLPYFMEQYRFPGIDAMVWTETMSQRKEKMREGTSAAIALPGGVGTLDELFETVTLAKLGKYPGKIFVLNVDGFYDPLKSLIGHLVREGMFSADYDRFLSFPSTAGELLEGLKHLG